jgi:hypothetical protein
MEEPQPRGGSQLTDAAGTASEYYQHSGKTYRKSTHKEVNANWAIDNIQEYSKTLQDIAPEPLPEQDVQYESVMDFVYTMRCCASNPTSVFQWPSDALSFQQAFTVALHHLPPGCMVTLNRRGIPQHLKSASNELKSTVIEVYHGTSVTALPSIFEGGLKPSFGVGSDMLAYHHGCPVPGVYVAKSWKVASTYPGIITTLPHHTCKHGVSGGTLVAMDGTFPLRAVIRCWPTHQRIFGIEGATNHCSGQKISTSAMCAFM